MTPIYLAFCLVLPQADGAAYAKPRLLAEPAELVKSDEAKKLTILDARSQETFEAGHVPGALWVDVAAWSKAMNAGEDVRAWSKRLGELGIDPERPVVVYGDASPDAARAWWVLRYWGVKDVRLLNGGWKGWKAAGGQSETKVHKPAPTSPTLKPESKRLASKAELLQGLKAGDAGLLIDSRSRGEHCGESKTAKRNGAIPGAKHLDWSDTLDRKTGRFKSAAELTKLFRDAGIDLDKQATTYCQSGGRAAVMAFVVELMSGKPARNYYRSWSEWGNDPRTLIEVPKK